MNNVRRKDWVLFGVVIVLLALLLTVGVAADAELQKADTEGTGFSAGWQGMAAGTIGAYLDGIDSGFVMAATTVPITITYLIDETSGESITTGAATIYVTYTRIG